MSMKLHRAVRWRVWSAGLLAFGVAPAIAVAAPFCLSSQAIPPQCIYTDPSLCQRDAQQQHGVCTVNKAEFAPTPNLGQYCVVTASMVSLCIYPDRESCETDAQRRHGTCVAAPGQAPYAAPDPYNAINGR